jgi:hypothetical protein
MTLIKITSIIWAIPNFKIMALKVLSKVRHSFLMNRNNLLIVIKRAGLCSKTIKTLIFKLDKFKITLRKARASGKQKIKGKRVKKYLK